MCLALLDLNQNMQENCHSKQQIQKEIPLRHNVYNCIFTKPLSLEYWP